MARARAGCCSCSRPRLPPATSTTGSPTPPGSRSPPRRTAASPRCSTTRSSAAADALIAEAAARRGTRRASRGCATTWPARSAERTAGGRRRGGRGARRRPRGRAPARAADRRAAPAGARRRPRAARAASSHPGFVAATGVDRLADVERYLRAAARRLERLPDAVAVDRDRMNAVHELERAYRERLSRARAPRAARGPVDARGAPRQPLRADARHARADLREAHPPRARPRRLNLGIEEAIAALALGWSTCLPRRPTS